MKVAVTTAPRCVEVDERPDPSPPAPGQTVVRVETVGICGSDLHLYRNELGDSHVGLLPRIMGHEFSAVVEHVDPAGSDLRPGDRVRDVADAPLRAVPHVSRWTAQRVRRIADHRRP